MPTTQPATTTPSTATVGQFADRAARKAEDALESTQQAATSALGSLKDSVAHAREAAPAAISRAAEQVQDYARRGMERAREVSGEVRDRAQRASDRTVHYIQDEPVKAVLIAAATGAVIALLVNALSGRTRE